MKCGEAQAVRQFKCIQQPVHLWSEANSDPKRSPSRSTQHSTWICSDFSRLIAVTPFYTTLEMSLCFSVCKYMRKTEGSRQESVFQLQGSLSGYTWAVSRLQADYLYSHTVCLQRGSEAGLDPRTAQRVPSGAAHPSSGFYTVYSVFCFDSKMPTASALVTHRLERHHFKSDYPDITSVLRHLHLYKLNFNFCWLAWEVIFTPKLWKPCLFLLGFWICRPKYTFGDHICKLGLRRSHFPIKIKEFREKHKLPSDFHGLWSSHTWWWSDRSDFKTYILRILHKYTWYWGLCEWIN